MFLLIYTYTLPLSCFISSVKKQAIAIYPINSELFIWVILLEVNAHLPILTWQTPSHKYIQMPTQVIHCNSSTDRRRQDAYKSHQLQRVFQTNLLICRKIGLPSNDKNMKPLHQRSYLSQSLRRKTGTSCVSYRTRCRLPMKGRQPDCDAIELINWRRNNRLLATSLVPVTVCRLPTDDERSWSVRLTDNSAGWLLSLRVATPTASIGELLLSPVFRPTQNFDLIMLLTCPIYWRMSNEFTEHIYCHWRFVITCERRRHFKLLSQMRC